LAGGPEIKRVTAGILTKCYLVTIQNQAALAANNPIAVKVAGDNISPASAWVAAAGSSVARVTANYAGRVNPANSPAAAGRAKPGTNATGT
jgi:hypothetical protein